MAKFRPQKTLADYVVIAISPALIMLLVGSLSYFLLEVFYDGQWEGRMRWILFWFVLAAVLVSRIAIEQGTAHAGVYGFALAGATALFVLRFVDTVFVGFGLLAVVWWCAHKLTNDCTLIDESQDASGEGLLQKAGLEESSVSAGESDDRNVDNRDLDENQPHAPGLWVVYFSLAALPLFGLGQLLIPATDVAGRGYAFRLLWVYVAAALALLLTTSFLALRRYLRQRRLQMPAPIVGQWLGLGTLMIIVILAVCVLLPRPNADYSLTALLGKLAGKEHLQASPHDQVGGEAGEGEGRRAGEDDSDQQPQPAESKDGDKDGNSKTEQRGDGEGELAEDKQDGEESDSAKADSEESEQAGNNDSDNSDAEEATDPRENSSDAQQQSQQEGRRQSGGKGNSSSGQAQGESQESQQANDDAQGESESGEQSNRKSSQPSDQSRPFNISTSWLTGWAAQILQWIIYAVLAAVALWFLIKHRTGLSAALQQIWQQILNWLGRSKSKTDRGADRGGPVGDSIVVKPFSSFRDPFLSGSSNRWPPDTLVVYSFEALQAWAADQGVARLPEQTPIEFVQHVQDRFPEMADILGVTGRLYGRVAYADFVPSRKEIEPLRSLWLDMSAYQRLAVSR